MEQFSVPVDVAQMYSILDKWIVHTIQMLVISGTSNNFSQSWDVVQTDLTYMQ